MQRVMKQFHPLRIVSIPHRSHLRHVWRSHEGTSGTHELGIDQGSEIYPRVSTSRWRYQDKVQIHHMHWPTKIHGETHRL